MSISISYPFDTASNYTYDSNYIEITGGKARLALQQGDVDFTQSFTTDTGFTYDNTKAEFIGGLVRQKDQRPANSIVAANFNSSANANWAADGFVSLTAGVNGSPSLSGNKLLCDYTVNSGQNGIYYSDTLIGNLSGNWVAKFKYTPNYSTTPPENINIFSLSPSSGTTDDLEIFNSPSGNNIRITANGLSAITFGTWTPTSGQEYVFEIICVTNQVSVYIDGVQLGTAKTITPGQGTGAVRAWLGAYSGGYNKASGYFDDFILYSTASQDTGYTFPDTQYAQSVVVLPEMQHTGDGTIKLFNSLSMTTTGTVGILLDIGQSGNKLYWNGVTWAVSSDPYTQYTDLATFNLNCTSLPVNGEIYGQFTLVFFNTNTQGSVDELTANLNVDIGYSTTNPYLTINSTIRTDALESFSETSTKNGTDEIKYTLGKNGVQYYWNGTAWAISDGTYSQASTAADIETNKASFTTIDTTLQIRIFLHSGDGSDTPEIDLLTISYSFAGSDQSTLDTCIVYWYSDDILGEVNTESITVTLYQDAVQYKTDTVLQRTTITVTPNENGYCEVELIENENMPTGAHYIFNFGNRSYKFAVPNEANKNLWGLTSIT